MRHETECSSIGQLSQKPSGAGRARHVQEDRSVAGFDGDLKPQKPAALVLGSDDSPDRFQNPRVPPESQAHAIVERNPRYSTLDKTGQKPGLALRQRGGVEGAGDGETGHAGKYIMPSRSIRCDRDPAARFPSSRFTPTPCTSIAAQMSNDRMARPQLAGEESRRQARLPKPAFFG
jgi:hypothetical protein